MDLISIFRICFYVCLAFTILFFIISVVLFFLFDIKTIFNIRTGRAKQKTIKEMQAAKGIDNAHRTKMVRVGRSSI